MPSFRAWVWGMVLLAPLALGAAPREAELVVTVESPEGAPAAGVKVELQALGEMFGVPVPMGSRKSTAETGRDGKARFKKLRVGSYAAGVEHRTPEHWWAGGVTVRVGEQPEARLRLIRLATLTLKVTDEKGAAAEGESVMLFPREVGNGSLLEKNEAKTDGRGVCIFSGVPEGQWTARLAGTAKHEQLETSLEVASLETAGAIQFRTFARLSGRFVDERGAPIAGVRWSIDRDSGVSESGSFEATVVRPDLPQRLDYAAPGFQSHAKLLPPGTAFGALGDLVLKPEVPLVIRVTGPDGAPIAGADVDFTEHCPSLPCGAISPMRQTDAAGELRVAGYGGRVATISISAKGYQPMRVDFRKPTPQLDVRLERPAAPLPQDTQLTVVVRDPAGKPMKVHVRAGAVTAETDAQGIARLMVSAGRQVVLVEPPGIAAYWAKRVVELSPKVPLRVEMVLYERKHNLKVRAPWAHAGFVVAGTSLPESMVAVYGLNNQAPPTDTLLFGGRVNGFRTEDQRFRFPGVVAGPHLLVLLRPGAKAVQLPITLNDADSELTFEAPPK